MDPTFDSDGWPEPFPISYQDINDLAQSGPEGFNIGGLRFETIRRISNLTARPLVCYVAKTRSVPFGAPVSIDDGDLVGFNDLTRKLPGTDIDICLISNGGSAEAAERIVELIRDRFDHVRFLLPGNAYSAATLICFSGDELIVGPLGTLGPIDPQLNGVPARAILRGFESIEAKLRETGPKGITAYLPLLEKYDLHILEMCQTAKELSEELARDWLSEFMFKSCENPEKIEELVAYFSNYDERKSHGRSIGRAKVTSAGHQLTASLQARAKSSG